MERDFQKAAYWLEKASRQEDPHAQYMLACLYEGGDGFPRDRAKSAYWLKKAAENGREKARHLWATSGELVSRFEEVNRTFDTVELPKLRAAGMGDMEIAGRRFLWLQEWI